MTFVKDINVGIIQAHSKGIGTRAMGFYSEDERLHELHILHGQRAFLSRIKVSKWNITQRRCQE